MNKIRISSLPYELQQKIPLSIRIVKDEYDLDELPPEVQSLVKAWIEKIEGIQGITQYYDIKPNLIASSLEEIKTLKHLTAYYIACYLLTPKGVYPGDVTFGSNLKKYVQIKDEAHRRELISKEIHDAVNYVSKILDTRIIVKSATSSYDPVTSTLSVNLELEVENETVSHQIKVTQE